MTRFVFFRLSLLLFAAFHLGCQPPAATPAPAKPPEVQFVLPVSQTVLTYEEFTGRTWAVKTVEVRPRVSGYLEKIAFEDGQLVEEGSSLFQIDDQSFKAELLQAEAAIAQYRARLDRLTKQEQRTSQLAQTNVVTQQEFESITGDRIETDALLSSALAAKQIAELNLSYAQVRAPISGRISRHLVDAGNLVKADETMLANIISVNPMHVYFDIDERTVLRMKRLLQDGQSTSARHAETQVLIALADETEFKRTGTVNFIDNQIDPATGTLRFRCVVNNEDGFYSPGLFARVRFPIGEPEESLLVPEESLGADQGQRFVYVINPSDEVEYRPVVTGTLVGGLRVIKSGVEPGDRVVVTGLQRIRKGLKVNPLESSMNSDSKVANQSY